MKFSLPLLERVRELFSYDPESGILTRRTDVPKGKAGSAAGTRNSHGHLICRVDYKIYYVHRLIWLLAHGQAPPQLIDHVNGDRSDNRLANLRPATYAQNKQNSVKSKSVRSGIKGAHYSTSEQKWRSSIGVNGTKIHLGWFSSKEEAAAAYQRAAPLYHREFAKT